MCCLRCRETPYKYKVVWYLYERMDTDNKTFPEPAPLGFTVYTKMLCPYCERTKNALQGDYVVKYVDCDEILIKDKEIFLREMEVWCGKSHRTFPMVFFDGVFLGGFTDLDAWLGKRDAFTELDSF